jgi:predicted Zn-ribbon and HTH transcriptional regulator
MIHGDRFAQMMDRRRILLGDGCRRSGPLLPHILECSQCAFEPPDQITPPAKCPKCHGSAWIRYPRRTALLFNADRN